MYHAHNFQRGLADLPTRVHASYAIAPASMRWVSGLRGKVSGLGLRVRCLRVWAELVSRRYLKGFEGCAMGFGLGKVSYLGDHGT